MKCERCGALIRNGEEMQHTGRTVCEDCYIDILSPARACDPWAVYTAKSFSGSEAALTENQVRILKLLEETGGIEPDRLAEKLKMSLSDLEREFATLRHMEKARAQMRNGKKMLCLF